MPQRRVTRRFSAMKRMVQADKAADEEGLFGDDGIEQWRQNTDNQPAVFVDPNTSVARPASPGPKSRRKSKSKAKSKKSRVNKAKSHMSASPTKKFFLRFQKIGEKVIKFKYKGAICGEWKIPGKYKITSRIVELMA